MYNADQKLRYLNYCRNNRFEEPTVELIQRIFKSTKTEEEQFDKDVSEFNQIEVTDLLKSFNSKSRTRLKTTCMFLRDYSVWCYQEGLVDSIINPFDNRVTETIINTLIVKDDLNKKYFTKEQFIKNINDNIPDVTNRFIAYTIYSGLNLEELVNIKITDLDFDNNRLKLITGREITIDNLFKHLMIESNDQIQYFYNGIEVEDTKKRYTYGESKYVIKKCGVKNCDAVRPLYINFRMKTIKEQMDNEFISISTIYKNGLINL
jgi:integrase